MKKFEFDEKEHLYTLDGKPLTGVTTILKCIAKPKLIQWAADEAIKYVREESCDNPESVRPWKPGEWILTYDRVLEEARVAHKKKKESAGTWGTRIHKCLENHIKGVPFDTEKDIKEPVDKLIEWLKDKKVIESEIRMYSEDWWVAGTADLIIEMEGKRFIGDFKTSSGIYPEYFIQCSAYAKMARDMGIKIDGIVIINVTKKGQFNVEKTYGVDEGIEAFASALNLYRYLEKYKELT